MSQAFDSSEPNALTKFDNDEYYLIIRNHQDANRSNFCGTGDMTDVLVGQRQHRADLGPKGTLTIWDGAVFRDWSEFTMHHTPADWKTVTFSAGQGGEILVRNIQNLWLVNNYATIAPDFVGAEEGQEIFVTQDPANTQTVNFFHGAKMKLPGAVNQEIGWGRFLFRQGVWYTMDSKVFV